MWEIHVPIFQKYQRMRCCGQFDEEKTELSWVHLQFQFVVTRTSTDVYELFCGWACAFPLVHSTSTIYLLRPVIYRGMSNNNEKT